MTSGPPSPDRSRPHVTELLVAWGRGDRSALDELVRVVHQALRRLLARPPPQVFDVFTSVAVMIRVRPERDDVGSLVRKCAPKGIRVAES